MVVFFFAIRNISSWMNWTVLTQYNIFSWIKWDALTACVSVNNSASILRFTQARSQLQRYTMYYLYMLCLPIDTTPDKTKCFVCDLCSQWQGKQWEGFACFHRQKTPRHMIYIYIHLNKTKTNIARNNIKIITICVTLD